MSEALSAIKRLLAAGDSGVLITRLDGERPGSHTLVDPAGTILAGDPVPDDVVTTALENPGSPRMLEGGSGSWFVEPVVPPPRLVVLGAIATADALVPMAAAAGYAVHLIDLRPWLARPERHPKAVSVRCGPPAEMLEQLGIDSATAVVSFLHDARLEDDVLITALRSAAFYVGAMGSRATTRARRERLLAVGLDAELIDRLHAPIGLDLGSRTPQEMAVAVLAEIVAARGGPAGR